MTVESIKEAIAELGAEEKTSLTAWLLEQDAAEWDRQMEEDFSPGGAGMALLEEAESDVAAGRVKSMDEFLAEAKARRKTQDHRRP
jgi:hypothetical protein